MIADSAAADVALPRLLALLQAIARKESGAICIAAGPRLMLDVEILPWAM